MLNKPKANYFIINGWKPKNQAKANQQEGEVHMQLVLHLQSRLVS